MLLDVRSDLIVVRWYEVIGNYYSAKTHRSTFTICIKFTMNTLSLSLSPPSFNHISLSRMTPSCQVSRNYNYMDVHRHTCIDHSNTCTTCLNHCFGPRPAVSLFFLATPSINLLNWSVEILLKYWYRLSHLGGAAGGVFGGCTQI